MPLQSLMLLFVLWNTKEDIFKNVHAAFFFTQQFISAIFSLIRVNLVIFQMDWLYEKLYFNHDHSFFRLFKHNCLWYLHSTCINLFMNVCMYLCFFYLFWINYKLPQAFMQMVARCNDFKSPSQKKKKKYFQVWWPILEVGALHLTHPSAHSQQWVVNTHTVNTHTEQWAAIAIVPGEQFGVRCLAQGHLSHGIEGGESAVHSQSPPSIPARHEIRTHNLWIISLTL